MDCKIIHQEHHLPFVQTKSAGRCNRIAALIRIAVERITAEDVCEWFFGQAADHVVVFAVVVDEVSAIVDYDVGTRQAVLLDGEIVLQFCVICKLTLFFFMTGLLLDVFDG